MLRAAAVSTVLATIALVASTAAVAADPQMFQTPSKNIACATFESTLRCDMRVVGNSSPAKPSSCEGDYGHAFGVTKTAAKGRRLCVSDAVGGPGTPTIAYDRTWKRNGFTCRVRRSGLRCTNGGGHGFELRRGRQQLF